VVSKRGQYRFSDHFHLNKQQSQLDFVDIPLDTDISLYVDPYALNVSGNDWLRECGNIVVSFFDYFLGVIRKSDRAKSMMVLATPTGFGANRNVSVGCNRLRVRDCGRDFVGSGLRLRFKFRWRSVRRRR
jgi:hypothetical protein